MPLAKELLANGGASVGTVTSADGENSGQFENLFGL